MDEEELREELEQSIDSNSVQFWLHEIASICREKADFIESDWQDSKLARNWNLAANAIEKCAESAAVDNISF